MSENPERDEAPGALSDDAPTTPARKIQRQALSLSGRLYFLDIDVGFESGLEYKLARTMIYLPGFRGILEQPVEIAHREGRYFPDYLARWAHPVPNLLCEAKPRDRLLRDWGELEPKYLAADTYAARRNWQFRIFTDEVLDSDLVANIDWLLSYRQYRYDCLRTRA
jgi:hypothetical protein